MNVKSKTNKKQTEKSQMKFFKMNLFSPLSAPASYTGFSLVKY